MSYHTSSASQAMVMPQPTHEGGDGVSTAVPDEYRGVLDAPYGVLMTLGFIQHKWLSD
jgi:hypothetical protein